MSEVDCPLPTLDRFSGLVGLRAANTHGGWWVGRREPSRAAILLAPIAGTTGESIRNIGELGAATNIGEVLIDEGKNLMEELRPAREEHDIARELHHKTWKALSAYLDGDFDLACEIYEECDRSGTLDALQLVTYANALGRCAPGTGLEVVKRAELQAREAQPDLLSELPFGWALSKGYALNGGADSAVAWLRRIEGIAGEPAFSEQFLTASELDGIRGTPAFRNYLDELASRSTNE